MERSSQKLSKMQIFIEFEQICERLWVFWLILPRLCLFSSNVAQFRRNRSLKDVKVPSKQLKGLPQHVPSSERISYLQYGVTAVSQFTSVVTLIKNVDLYC